MAEWLALALVMTATGAVVLAVVMLKHRREGEEVDPSETPDVIEYMVMMIGVVYAIVLGLAMAGVWEGRGAAQDSIRVEAQALREVQERAAVYPAPVRDRIREDVDAYVVYTVEKEWPRLVDGGELTARGNGLLAAVREDVAGYEPRTDREAQAYQPMVEQVALADNARIARGDSAGPTMPGVVWFGLLAGAAIVVGLVFALQIQRSARELLVAALFSTLIAFLLFLVWEFDAPLGRDASDTVGPFRDLFPMAFSGN